MIISLCGRMREKTPFRKDHDDIRLKMYIVILLSDAVHRTLVSYYVLLFIMCTSWYTALLHVLNLFIDLLNVPVFRQRVMLLPP